jgi:hypothetical protein
VKSVLCVYALAAHGVGRIGRSGVAGERLRATRIGAIDAIVGEVATVPRPTDKNLRTYDRLLSLIWGRSPAVLPARFGTVVRDRAELEVILADRQETLRSRLQLVRNRAQMTIRIVQGAGDRGQGSASTRLQAGPSDPQSRGRSYLEQRARTAHDVPEFAPVREAVRRWVKAERVERQGNIATIYHLVPRGSAERYQESIRRAARDGGVRLLVSGPWPAYAFADTLS